jgi:hypothetical protein
MKRMNAVDKVAYTKIPVPKTISKPLPAKALPKTKGSTDGPVMRRIKKLPLRTTVAALLMFTFGAFFLLCGFTCLWYCEDPWFSVGWFFAGSVIFW